MLAWLFLNILTNFLSFKGDSLGHFVETWAQLSASTEELSKIHTRTFLLKDKAS